MKAIGEKSNNFKNAMSDLAEKDPIRKEKDKLIAAILAECRQMIESLRANDAFMSIQVQANSLQQYAESLDTLETDHQLSLGYLTSVQNTLELWKRDWEVLIKTDDVIDQKMLEAFRQKIGSLKDDPVFMGDKSRAERLGNYEKILDQVETEKLDDWTAILEELRQVEVTLDMWVVNWAVQSAKDSIDNND